MLSYDEIIETQGVRIPFVPAIITPPIERPMRNNRYEGGECATLRRVLAPGDRVLELGAGLGLISTVAAGVPGVERIVSVEANPDLIPLIRETHRLNGVTKVDLRNAIVAPEAGEDAPFYLRRHFWASSMEPDSFPFRKVVSVARLGLGELIAELDPTVIVCDIEGGELGLFDRADLARVRAVVLELHPKVYGDEGLARIAGALAAKGLALDPGNRPDSSVQLFLRGARPAAAAPATAPASPHAGRESRPWPVAGPRVLVATCMKDEGPFILEWLAWHRAAGVTDFVVFSNDCTDGTDRLLDRLHAMGEVVHLPNPAAVSGGTAFQPTALAFAERMAETRAADFFISMDVDEFINVQTGDGRLADLFAATGPFDVLSMTEVNHGANRREHYERGWLKDLFPAHQTSYPGNRRARRGVKSIVRLSDRVAKLRNHRPDLATGPFPPLWLDGSGRFLAGLAADPAENGIDSRGTLDLVRLEHFALRSLASYLVKMYRGDVVVTGKKVSQTYWRLRNRNEETSADYARLDPAARACHRERFEGDAALMALHEAACAAHEARIEALLRLPEFVARRDWALREVW